MLFIYKALLCNQHWLIVLSFLAMACHEPNANTDISTEMSHNSHTEDSANTDTDCNFVCLPDDAEITCDLWTQDCPEGQKCMPWDSDGDFSWNATKCTDLALNPDKPGDECTVSGHGSSGIDSCEKSSMCYGVDTHGNGTCIPFCTGSLAEPQCQDPKNICSISANNGVLILCRPRCNPMLQDCQDGQACLSAAGTSEFACITDASGEAGQAGDACEFVNACDPGLFCADSSTLPECANSSGCCTAFCDLNAPDICTNKIIGTECIPWYAPEEAPEGLENVGGCILPLP